MLERASKTKARTGNVNTLNKYVDLFLAEGTALIPSAIAATPNTLALRGWNGRLKAADGWSAEDVVNKGQLDEAVVPLTVSTSAPGSPSLGDLWVDIS